MVQLKEKRRAILVTFTGFVLLLAGVALVPASATTGILYGYLLGAVAVALHLLTLRFLQRYESKKFTEGYYLSILIRFLLVLSLFTLILLFGKIDQLYFTLSFIISYLFHSVIDFILIHKIFAKDTYQNQ